MDTIAFQPELRPELPVVYGAKDYREFRDTLIEMDRILTVTGLEDRFVSDRIESCGEGNLSPAKKRFLWRTSHLALRYSILRALTQVSFRVLARQAADSQLFQWFTHTAGVDCVRPVSKSSAERFEKFFTMEQIGSLIHTLNQAVADKDQAAKLLYAETELRFDRIFADTTCAKADIHFPVDWVLLRDATRTLVKGIILIRDHGLKHRISAPEMFLRKINKLSIEMTHTRKKLNAQKLRKAVLRRMKKLLKVIEGHAQRYLDQLESRWQETDWSELEKNVVASRIKDILDQLPLAVHQAHERIIGERRVANKDKILSLYDGDVEVLVRGKAGAEVEFGNALYLAEQADGLIVDWELMKNAKSDARLVKPSIERISSHYGKPERYCGDRGFDSPSGSEALETERIVNAICPRSVAKFRQQLHDPEFRADQQRRGATEARIGIFKNDYLGRPMRSKGFSNRQTHVVWCVLVHNLWKLARMAAINRKQIEAQQQKAA